jgi:hypothetical protein
MAVDYTQFAYPKTRVKALEKADKAKAIEAQDRTENAKAKKRAKGRCERVEVVNASIVVGKGDVVEVRCHRKDAHVHHLISGIGRRNMGRSIFAEHKLCVCEKCHADIHAKVLQPTTSTDEAASIRYRRAR